MPAVDRDFVQSLARGLEVIRSFGGERPRQTLSDVARHTGLSRAACRRLLHTLEELGYVTSDGRDFTLTPRILDVGYSYISSLPFHRIVEPFVEQLSERIHESVSVSVLDGTDIVYVIRVATSRIMTISLSVGVRLPAHCTSMGRVLLANRSELEQSELLRSADLTPRTEFSISSEDALLAELAKVGNQGWALNDQELEIGVRSIAGPIRNASGRAIAAMNISANASRISSKDLEDRLLPQLLETTQRVSEVLGKR